jgi:anti-anti-sigma factor
MSRGPSEQRGDLSSECPLCGSSLACEPPIDVRCQECGRLVWFLKRTTDDAVILDALHGRIPEAEDIESLCKTLVHPGTVPLVAVNLSQAEIVDSTFIASLVGLRRRLLAAEGKLVLYSPCRAMREVLHYTRLEGFFDTFDTEENALGALRSATD